MIHMDNLGYDFSDCLAIVFCCCCFFSVLNCQMRNLGENQNLFQILRIKHRFQKLIQSEC